MRGRDERGFSLVEVIIALGLLAGVLVTISGLFVVGTKQVKSGRTSSEALAVAKEIQEDMYGWGYSQLGDVRVRRAGGDLHRGHAFVRRV